jgi:hypothetical protein
MKLQIISALLFLFLMTLFSFVKLQITPTKYGTQISFGQESQPVNLPTATATIAANRECYSVESELKEQNNSTMLAAFDQSSDQQLKEIEHLIEKLTATSSRQLYPGKVEMSKNLP